jgi:hypothetical protein
MVTYVTEFCCRFPHNVINATKGETAAVNINYAFEESLGAYRNLVETLLGQLESSCFCFQSLREGNMNAFKTPLLKHHLVAID